MRRTPWVSLLRLGVAVLSVLGLGLAAFFGFIALVAFSDARYRCPGIQCHDAVSTTVFGVVVLVLSLLGSLLGLGWLARSSRR